MSTAVVQKKPETAIADLPPKQASLLQIMAGRYHMDPKAYADAVRKTAMPGNATNEEFAAFMLVAYEYKLNPLLKEIYAFPKKGGGVVPMVSIDGWINLINSNPMLRGFELEPHLDEKSKLAAVTCKVYRKDRDLPVVITEYMAECFRPTEPWKMMPSRMLRHKALIQAARYAFGLSGIYDEDEARDMTMKDVTPIRPTPQDFVLPVRDQAPAETQEVAEPVTSADPETGEVKDEAEPGPADAYQAGQVACSAGKRIDEVPSFYKGAMAEAWRAGFKARLDESAAA
jgi:phage recombination protein Bet